MRPEELIDVPVLAHALTELRTEDRLSEIPLGLLSEDNSRALVRVLHPSARSGQHWNRITGEIWALSAGNPFVIVESCGRCSASLPRTGRASPASPAA